MSSISKISNLLFLFLMTCYFSITFCLEAVSSQEPNSMMNNLATNYFNIEKSGTYLISLFAAIILASIIAFHPQTFGKNEDLQEIEAPKTMIFYAVIGSLVGYIVGDYGSEFGFIFFGLGGLMRFRTNMGTSVQTGRLILVALIGLSCGLRMIYIAVLSTIVCWILIYFLERKKIYKIEIKGINSERFLELVESYRHILQQKKCKIVIEKKNQAKSKVSFILSSVPKLDRSSLQEQFNKNVAEIDHVSISCSALENYKT